jgi:hypothetical protein
VRQHTDAALPIRYPAAVKADHAHELVELTQGARNVVPTKRNGRCLALLPTHFLRGRSPDRTDERYLFAT